MASPQAYSPHCIQSAKPHRTLGQTPGHTHTYRANCQANQYTQTQRWCLGCTFREPSNLRRSPGVCLPPPCFSVSLCLTPSTYYFSSLASHVLPLPLTETTPELLKLNTLKLTHTHPQIHTRNTQRYTFVSIYGTVLKSASSKFIIYRIKNK